jgi:hypothetical protein
MARSRPDVDEMFRRSKLHRYLLADEQVLIAQRQHWAKIGKPIAIAVGGLLVVLTLNVLLPPSFLTDLLWWALLPLALWTLGKFLLWRREWLVATDKRLMVNYGLIHQGVSMFSLSRVTDVTYVRSTLGQLLGYGTLKREGTSLTQPLHDVRFVAHPHATYTTICAAIFELQDRMFGMDDDEDDHRLEEGPPPPAPELYSEYLPPEVRTGPTGSRVNADATPPEASKESDESEESEESEESGDDLPAVRIRYGTPLPSNQGSSYQGQRPPGSPINDATTGSLPYRRPTTDPDAWRPTTDGDGA